MYCVWKCSFVIWVSGLIIIVYWNESDWIVGFGWFFWEKRELFGEFFWWLEVMCCDCLCFGKWF